MKMQAKGKYKFKQATVASPNEYLNISLGVEKYLKKYELSTSDGICWKKKGATWNEVSEDEIDLSFYSGNTGILYFYLKLYEVTQDQQYKDTILQASSYIASNWRNYFNQTPIFGSDFMSNGLYMGVGGIGLILLETYKLIGSEAAKQGALEIYEYYKEISQKSDNGIYWSNSPAVAMDGGIILFFLEIHKIFGFDEAKDFIIAAGNHYITSKTEHEDSYEYRGWPGPGTRPNYEFGTAGAGYILTLLYEFTGEDKFLDAAKKADAYMRSIKIPQPKGYLHPYDTEMEHPIYFLSSCHGVGGNSKLYYKLYELTKDNDYLSQIEQMVDGIESQGAPENTSDGFWNTLCFCCGHAGMLHYFIALYNTLGDERYLDLAHRTASILIGEAIKDIDGSVYWPMAFWRVKPDFLTVDLGFHDGITGIATVLLEIYLLEKNEYKWNRLIDDPFN